MSSSGAAAQYKLDANSNAIVLITDAAGAVAALPPSPSAPGDRIEWSRATILGFIEDYRRQRVLWDPNTKGYHIKQTKYEALKLLSEKYGTEIRSIRSKIKSLRSSFHREHGKVLNGRNRGVHYQPMWFAYEAIRFILDGDVDVDSNVAVLDAAAVVEPVAVDSEAADKLALMHSLDLEQLTAAGKQQQVVEQQQQQQQQQQSEEFAARVAAAVAAVAAAAAANIRERDHHLLLDTNNDAATSEANSNGCAGVGSDATAAAAADAAATASVSAAVTRSSSDLDGENYCNISAEDVKTEIIEHESELGLLDRQTSTPLSLSYFKPTDLTYNPRKRKAQNPMDDNDDGGSDCGVGDAAAAAAGPAGVGVGIVGGVVGALTLTPIKSSSMQSQSQSLSSQQQQLQLNHSQIAFHALQQHFSHSHNLSHSSHNGNGHSQQHFHHHHHQQQQQQQQQQHSNNMAQKRDRDRDLSSSPTEANNNSNNNNHSSSSNSNNNNNRNSSTSLELTTATAATTSNSSSSSSGISSSLKLSTNANNNNNSSNNISSNHVDEYGVFGEYVAITIRKLKTSKSKIVVKHLINNLLYEAELGKYDQGMPASKEPPQLYKMQ
ncbi:GATA zinc finger domain-containing protein 7 [Drosophila sulfurigaster albostrigata]|uniref:GATA zinc finger domain-containing protein 7 n=1 Tax=Drosophila sulfurigaster albostrigata TaxID=89887 RepID=UPI002D21EB8A|nr:GATA zinc finger domain-containing protein 7 [Drosophila sulfurigaster albostrigata]XP_062129964.1 GATA zinc finger domain-containing protein 7 [Drosophila sulfurigaster albostrigata]